jgi:hypothetical protein
LGAFVASAVILAAWFPLSSLLNQGSTISAGEGELTTLHQQDRALAQEKKSLSNTAEIERIAREQYQLVNPGQQAYEVLPPAGRSAPGAPYAGDPGLMGPVAPSAAAELPPGSTSTTTSAAAGSSSSNHGQPASASANSGILERMLHDLEFWR